VKLRVYSDLLDGCIARVTASLYAELPEFGTDLAIDASDMPAYANGQRYLSKNGPERQRYSDPDATSGHRSAVSTRKGGGFYGFRLHAAVCARTDLPVAWRVETAASHESNYVASLLDTVKARGFDPDTCALDMGYDNNRVYGECEERDIRPIIPLRETPEREGREGGTAELRARNVALRRVGLKARSVEVALPDRRVLAREPVGRRRPAASPRAPGDATVAEALQGPRGRRAGVRTLEARVGLGPAPRAWSRSGRAPRRPDDPYQAGLCAQSGASRAARGVLTFQGMCHLHQERVPRRVSGRVVDLLEPVEVYREDREGTQMAMLRTADYVARVGGDEFVVLLPEVKAGTVEAMTEKLLRSLGEIHIPFGATTLTPCASIGGVTCLPPGDETWNPDFVLHAADLELYTAKARGRDGASHRSLACAT